MDINEYLLGVPLKKMGKRVKRIVKQRITKK